MVGDIFLNFGKDKFLNIRQVKKVERGIQIELENGDVELVVRLSKKQTAQLRAALDEA